MSSTGTNPVDLDTRWAAILALALPAILYLATLYPGIGDRAASGDAVEFQYVGRALSVPHEPGYPQYVLLSFLWSWIPLPLTLATKINLLSAVFAAAAGGFLFATAHAMNRVATAAVLACWALLTAPDLWLLATQAEVYTLHVLWVTVFFWAALRWRRSGTRSHLLVLLFAYALAFGNHLTMITLLPALALLLLTRQPQLVTAPWAWRWAITAALAGAAQYLLLVWRSYFPHPTLLERFPLRARAGEILQYITGDRFVEKHWLPADGEWLARTGEALAHGVEQLTPFGVLLAVYGAVSGWRRDPPRTLFLLAAAGSVVLFAVSYGIRDWLLYCIPAWVVAALLAADGLARLFERLPRAGLLAAVALGLLLAPRIVAGVDRLRVKDNPADLTAVLATLPAGSRVIPAGGHRLTRLHRDYYRYGANLPAAQNVRFLAARQDVLQKGLHLRHRVFLFRHPTVAKIFSGRLIDYRVWPAWNGPGTPVLATGTDHPLSEVGLRALAGHEIEITVRSEHRTLGDEHDLYVFFAGAREGRAKGLEGLSFDEDGALERLRLLFDALPEGDLAVVLIPRLRERTREALDEILPEPAIPVAPTDESRLAIAWRHGGDPQRTWWWRDPPENVARTVALADL